MRPPNNGTEWNSLARCVRNTQGERDRRQTLGGHDKTTSLGSPAVHSFDDIDELRRVNKCDLGERVDADLLFIVHGPVSEPLVNR